MTSSSRRLLRLIYASRASQSPGPDLDDAVRDILIKSMSNNRLVDVTGLLLIHAGWFVQLLEGPEAGVRETITRIASDSRHNDISIRGESYTEARQFRDWNMTERRVNLADEPLLRQLGQDVDFNPTRLSEDDALNLLVTLGAGHVR